MWRTVVQHRRLLLTSVAATVGTGGTLLYYNSSKTVVKVG